MSVYIKAAIGTLFLALTLGAMGEVIIWGVLTMFHVNNFVVLSGETVGAIVLIGLSVPVFQRILRNERNYGLTPVMEEPEIVIAAPKRPQGPKPTAFV